MRCSQDEHNRHWKKENSLSYFSLLMIHNMSKTMLSGTRSYVIEKTSFTYGQCRATFLFFLLLPFIFLPSLTMVPPSNISQLVHVLLNCTATLFCFFTPLTSTTLESSTFLFSSSFLISHYSIKRNDYMDSTLTLCLIFF